MYLNFYELTREPFHVTPDPDFLYSSESHKQALAAIVYGVKQKKGFITITGPVGSGKTTILRAFLQQADPAELKVIYLFNPAVPFSTLVANLCREFELKPPENDVPAAVEMLYLALADYYGRGWTVVLLIDEAQNMPVETLENLRMLSNFETTHDKLVQIVLAGQPELEELLKQPSLKQLRQRRAIRAAISPLTEKESFSYVKYRIAKAGGDRALFNKKALEIFAKEARGIPRKLNILCDNALATGYAYGKRRIDAGVAREVIRDLEGTRVRWKTGAVAASVMAAIVGLAALFVIDIYPAGLLKGRPAPHSIRSQVQEAPGASSLGERAKTALNEESGVKEEVTVKQGYLALTDEKRVKTLRAGGATRTAKRGDTIMELIREVYGITEQKRTQSLIGEVMRSNPGIRNADFILEGQKIFFPVVKNSKVEATQ
jgi:general secretion pathway protein A